VKLESDISEIPLLYIAPPPKPLVERAALSVKLLLLKINQEPKSFSTAPPASTTELLLKLLVIVAKPSLYMAPPFSALLAVNVLPLTFRVP